MAKICTLCLICGKFIPVYNLDYAYPMICIECRRRLREMLYGKEDEDEHEHPD